MLFKEFCSFWININFLELFLGDYNESVVIKPRLLAMYYRGNAGLFHALKIFFPFLIWYLKLLKNLQFTWKHVNIVCHVGVLFYSTKNLHSRGNYLPEMRKLILGVIS